MTVEPMIEPEAAENAETCGACGHAMAAHDAVGTRFCAATLKGSLARGCLCPAAAR